MATEPETDRQLKGDEGAAGEQYTPEELAEGSDTDSKPGSSGWHIGLAAAASDDKPYLGDPKVVEQLVIDFVHHCANSDTVAEDRAEVDRLARLFAGKDDGHRGVGDWTRAGLADEVRARLGIRARDPEAALREAFAMLAHGVYRALKAHGQGNTAATKAQCRVLAREWTSLLLGTPSPHPELFDRSGQEVPGRES